MGDITYDPNDLLRQFDTVSRFQRALVAECERQQSRLVQLTQSYDRQKSIRNLELRRQFDQINIETRRQINSRSKVVLQERARLKHLLDDDNRADFNSTPHQKSFFSVKNSTEDRKRKVYGCLLPEFKAPLTKSLETWSQFKSDSFLRQSDQLRQRRSTKKFNAPPIDQRKRMDIIIHKCLYEWGKCEGPGYDHFLQTSEPNRNAQILAQQMMNDKNQNKYR